MFTFKRNDLDPKEEELGTGVYGLVKKGTLIRMQQPVAVKTFSQKCQRNDIMAEVVVGLEIFHMFMVFKSPIE